MTSSGHRPRVVLVDDDAILRYTLKVIVEEQCEVVGEAENGESAVELATTLHPDVVLLDITMPVMDGLRPMTQTEHRGAGNFNRNHPQGNKPTGVDHGPKFQQQKRSLDQRVAAQVKPIVELVKKEEQK